MPEDPNDATPFLPERPSLKALREAAAGCRGCHLWRPATQTVFGEGRRSSRVMLVGEQPGEKEDRAGKPFVGPAGRELDRGLEAAGIERRDAYLTNVVKHFKFEERGRRRIHQTPKRFEIDACRPWLEAETPRGRASGRRLRRICGRLRWRWRRPNDSIDGSPERGSTHWSRIARLTC